MRLRKEASESSLKYRAVLRNIYDSAGCRATWRVDDVSAHVSPRFAAQSETEETPEQSRMYFMQG